MSEGERCRWMPLESNPDIYEQWASSMGFDCTNYQFTEIYGFDPDLLAFVPRPVYAVLMLFPCESKGFREATNKENAEIAASGTKVDDVLYFKQTIGNACGTLGLLHALTNSGIPIRASQPSPDTPLARLVTAVQSKTPHERGKYLETCSELESAHAASAQSGQTATLAAHADVDHHFVAFVEKNGRCVELDGARPTGPIDRGPITTDLLDAVVEAAKKVMSYDQGNIGFNLVALTPAS